MSKIKFSKHHGLIYILDIYRFNATVLQFKCVSPYRDLRHSMGQGRKVVCNQQTKDEIISKWLYSKVMSFVCMVKTNKQLFYRYQSLKEEYDKGYNCKNYTLRNLAKNQLYFTDPRNFNDPFDCTIRVNYVGTEEQWIEFICKDDGCTREIAKEKVNCFRKTEDGLVFPYKESSNINVPGVCCFSATNNDILMWSHYADSHRGICLCFEGWYDNTEYYMPLYEPKAHPKNPYSIQFKKVDYDLNLNNNLCVLNAFENKIENARIAEEHLFIKLRNWNYENEYRMIAPNSHTQKHEIFEYNKDRLKGIIFGLKIDKQDIIRVFNIVNENYLKEGFEVKFCKAEEKKGKCEIIIVPIDIKKYIDKLT